MTMSISQALRLQKKLKGQVAELTTRLGTTILYTVGNEPAFTYDDTFAALEEAKEKLLQLSSRIAVTNAVTKLDGVSLSACVLKLQELKGTIASVKAMKVQAHAEHVKRETVSYSNPPMVVETKTVCKLPETEKVKRIEALQSEFDSLNDSVERVNHSTTLVAE